LQATARLDVPWFACCSSSSSSSFRGNEIRLWVAVMAIPKFYPVASARVTTGRLFIDLDLNSRQQKFPKPIYFFSSGEKLSIN
jgi:hypothetical protein